MPETFTTGFDVGGHVGELQEDEHYPQGAGSCYTEMKVEKFGNGGILLNFSQKIKVAPFTRESALAILRDLKEILGPDLTPAPDLRKEEYRHPTTSPNPIQVDESVVGFYERVYVEKVKPALDEIESISSGAIDVLLVTFRGYLWPVYEGSRPVGGYDVILRHKASKKLWGQRLNFSDLDGFLSQLKITVEYGLINDGWDNF
jgi:hypothetical protein